MDHRESDQLTLAAFFELWEYHKCVYGLHDKPSALRFHAFLAAWNWHDPERAAELPCARVGGPLGPPPEYDMLQDWLRDPSASGYWEPVKENDK